MRVALVNNAGTGSSQCSMREVRFPIGPGDLSAMLTRVGPAMVWKNPDRDEFTRHGVLDHSTCPEREAIDFTFRNGTCSGQSDRCVQTDAAVATRKPGRPSASGEAEPWRTP